MKSWLSLLLITVTLTPCCVWGQDPQHPPVLTLDECLVMAQGQNRTVRLSQQAVQHADGRIEEARGAGQPQFNATSGARLVSEEKNLPLAVGIDGTGQLLFANAPLAPDRTGFVGVGVSQIIDISGLIHTGITTASLGQHVAQLNVQRTRNDLQFQVKAAYYDILRAEALVAVAREAIQNAQLRRTTAQALVDAGINSKVDLFRADAAIAAAQQSLIAATNVVEINKAGLNSLLSRDVNAPFAVQSPNEAVVPVLPYETYLQEALTHRPEIMAAYTNLQLTEQQKTLALRGMRPSLILNAAAEYDVAHHVNGNTIGAVGAALVFPLSDGGITRGRVTQAVSDIASAMVASDETKARVSLDVKNAYVMLQNAGETLTTALKELDQATESLRLSRIRYEQGIANQVEISDAELQFTQAQTNVVNARFVQFVAQAALERAIGRYQQ